MSMKGTPREKLHWAFRLYDADESETIEEDELEDVFCRLFSIAKNIERAAEEARNPKPKKPRTPTPPPVETEAPSKESPPPEKKKSSDKKANAKKGKNVSVWKPSNPLKSNLNLRLEIFFFLKMIF